MIIPFKLYFIPLHLKFLSQVLRKSEKVAADKPAFTPDASEPGEDPSQGLMKMMKKMYEEGDDEMKRTIAKAWTEGNQKRNPGDMGDLAGLGGGMAGMDL